MVTAEGAVLLRVISIVLPETVMGPCVMKQLMGDGEIVGAMVNVEIVVAVGLSVIVGGNVGVWVRVGVLVNTGVGVGVRVGVFVGVFVGVGEGVSVCVAVLASQVKGGAVTSIATDTRILRALLPSIGSPLPVERSIKGTKRGMIGKKSPWISTMIRVVLSDDGVTFGSTNPSHVSKTAVPGPLSY